MWIEGGKVDTAVAPSLILPAKRKDFAVIEHAKAYLFDAIIRSNANPSISAIYASYREESVRLVEMGKLTDIIEERHFYRMRQKINNADIELAKANSNTRAKILRGLGYNTAPPFALDRVEVDRVQMNLGLIHDSDSSYTGPISMYIAIDCCTRVLLGIVVEFDAPETSNGVIALMRQMLVPLSEKSPFAGVPKKIVFDNGPGMKSVNLQQVLSNLKITDIYYAPPEQPWRKPFIESFNNLIVDEFFKKVRFVDVDGNSRIGIPGFLEKQRQQDENYIKVKLQDIACLQVSHFMKALTQWIDQYHNEDIHPSLKMTPRQKWEESMQYKPILPCSLNTQIQAFHVNQQQKVQKLQSRGWVQVRGQRFYSKEALELYLACCVGKKLTESIDVEVKYSIDDARHVSISVIKPSEKVATTILVPNRNISSMPNPISFEELETPKFTRRGVCVYEIERLPTPSKKRKNKRSVQSDSFETNLENNLSADDVIANSHRKFSPYNKSTYDKKSLTNQDVLVDNFTINTDDEENDLI
ncbi:hypothetical protein [Shewanella acanthi]|uniref:hypothetical protein n=1 Tax=Shewanella acanthi TaxID=2864212 RepID=UPI001C662077|nr:hypothetical protein [Shewanella acanthi]QYJ80483.1 hypothetical protein K0H61_09025 [Shewanella acanthi]